MPGLTILLRKVQETKFHDVSEELRRTELLRLNTRSCLPVLQDEALFHEPILTTLFDDSAR